ncbi:MAG: bacillithiol biosynthesis BshC, partial [Candidatus Eisenbacteria bacterium]|nr:bacillithiol biosynthesis BshC [Candidatus Latescibacterota bacterium]MBD3302407.1 bacillithiol biosynthesis BshC [Candidatus Eisenbacteria bacterium]
PGRSRALLAHLCAGDPLLAEWSDRLAAGKAGTVLTGQQPALLGGPLYTLYKTMTALVRARRLREAGFPAIAAFWCVGDDTDHDETGGASWPRADRPPARIRDERDSGGERIGGLSVERMEPALGALAEDRPDDTEAIAGIEQILRSPRVRDWSGFLRAALRRVAGEDPLLFVDGNDPVVHDAAQPFLRRFLDASLRERIAGEVDRLAARQEDAALTGEEVRRSLFLARGRGRVALEDVPLDRRPDGKGETLLPNVVLRPLLQEHLLPVQQVVCGDAEIAYRSLLGPLYREVGRTAAPVVPRFAATLLPALWTTDAGAPDPRRLLEDPDRAIEGWARDRLDPEIPAAIAEIRAGFRARLGELVPDLQRFDRSLGQVVDSAQKKIDFQVGRVEEAVLSKARSRLRRDYPTLGQIREILLPRGRPQERSFTLWLPWLAEGEEGLRGIERAVEDWLIRGETGHALLALERGL